MQKFLLKLINFIIGLTFLVIVLGILVTQDQYEGFKIDRNVTTAYMGDSSIAFSVNDSIIPTSYNIGRPAETPDWTYAKLKLIKKFNPEIDTVFVSLNDIGIRRNDHFTNNDFVNLRAFSIPEIIVNINDFLLEEGYSNSIISSFRENRTTEAIKNLYRIRVTPENLYGYEPLDLEKLDVDLANDTSKKLILENQGSRLKNLKYYKKIIEYCKNNNIQLYFITFPIHPDLWPILDYKGIYDDYLSEVNFIDCSHWVYPDSCYGDAIHLNHYGADLFTKELRKYIEAQY